MILRLHSGGHELLIGVPNSIVETLMLPKVRLESVESPTLVP